MKVNVRYRLTGYYNTEVSADSYDIAVQRAKEECRDSLQSLIDKFQVEPLLFRRFKDNTYAFCMRVRGEYEVNAEVDGYEEINDAADAILNKTNFGRLEDIVSDIIFVKELPENGERNL